MTFRPCANCRSFDAIWTPSHDGENMRVIMRLRKDLPQALRSCKHTTESQSTTIENCMVRWTRMLLKVNARRLKLDLEN